jgi:hypothetical protein
MVQLPPSREAQQTKPAPHRVYSDEEIDEFLEKDKIPEELLQKMQSILLCITKEGETCEHFSQVWS